MQRILVTGSGGIVGGHVIDLLGASDHNVDVVRFAGDLADFLQTKDAIDMAGPLDGVIHLGALVAVDQVKADPARAYSVNVGGTVHLLGALAQSRQAPHFFHCSSAHVYTPQSTAIAEDAATEPHSLYGRTKLMAEIAAKDICETHDIPLCIGRVFSIHDPRQTGPYLRPNILRRLTEENLDIPFDLYGADSVRDFLTARQAADVIVDLALRRFEGVINIGSGVATKIRDFVQDLAPRPLIINGLGGQDCLLADINKLTALQEA
ncbi:NAD(P)-dependent oxidoreductase [Octadecabacter sp.]|nr:NAD(P)-dependent oxidoreductase [Octadecabacter sp.]